MNTVAAVAIAPPKLDGTLGAILVGIFVSCVLYGLTVLQTVYYYMAFPKDHIHVKALVAVVWVLDTLQIAMACQAAYWYLITHYGDYATLNTVIWSLTADVFLTSAIAFVVQMYMIRRIFILSRNWFISGFLTSVALLAVGSGFAYGGRLAELGETSLIPKILFLIRTALGSALAVDALITITLIYYLNKNRSGMKSTDSIIDLLIIFAVNTGAITSLCALLDVIFHTTLPNTLAYESFYVILSKLYVNSFLGTLNAREIIRGAASAYQTLSLQVPTRSTLSTTDHHNAVSSNQDTLGRGDNHRDVIKLGTMKFAEASIHNEV